MSELLCALILGHFIADYWLQTDGIMKLKKSKEKSEIRKGLLQHVTAHLAIYFLIIWILKALSFKGLVMIICITFSHYIIDSIKLFIEKKEFKNKDANKISLLITSKFIFFKESTAGKALLYTIDQIIHIVIIFFLIYKFDYMRFTYTDISNFLNKFTFGDKSPIPHLDTVLLIASLTIITTHFMGYLIGIILANIKPLEHSFADTKNESKNTRITKTTVDKKKRKGKNKVEVTKEEVIEQTITNNHITEPEFEVGKYIGMLERIIIMILVGMHAFTGITFLVAIKAFTRFKQFDDKRFSEYYLIGSLISILSGIASGFILSLLIKIK